MKYKIELNQEDYFNLLFIIVEAYGRHNYPKAKGLFEKLVNDHVKVEDDNNNGAWTTSAKLVPYKKQCMYYQCFKKGQHIGSGTLKKLYMEFRACDEHHEYISSLMLEHD